MSEKKKSYATNPTVAVRRKKNDASQAGKRRVASRKTTRRKSGATRSIFAGSRVPIWGMLLGAVLFVAALVGFVWFFVGPQSFRWRSMIGEPHYPEGYKIRGIDVSHYQQNIRWEELRNASMNADPVTFVFIKATEGVSILDDNFNENFFRARQNDFVRGAYHFFTPDESAERQAKFFLHQVHLEPGDLPPVLDVEKIGKLSKQELQRRVKRWLDIVCDAYGVKPIIYTGYKFKLSYLSSPVFDDYPYWIAHYYVDKLQYRGKWAFWQHTDRGRLQGIKGDVDCNIFNGSREELMELTLKEQPVP